jgi:hypothetical protein
MEEGDGDAAGDPLLDEVETKVFYAGPDDPRNSWVKLIHRETGIEVESTTEGTQIKNRARALMLLRARLPR